MISIKRLLDDNKYDKYLITNDRSVFEDTSSNYEDS